MTYGFDGSREDHGTLSNENAGRRYSLIVQHCIAKALHCR